MRKLTAIACLFPLLLAGCKTACIEDSGNHIEKNSIVKVFDKISVTGAIKLVLRQDSSYAVKIATDSNLMKNVKIDVSSAQLNIKLDETTPYCGKDSVVVEAGIGELKELRGDGAIKIQSDGQIYAGDVKLNMSGSGDVSMNLIARKLTSNLDGTCKLKLSGQAGSHILMVQGIAEVAAFDFVAGIYDVGITGSAKANINVLNELNVNTEGSSDIHYKGNPGKVNEKKSGAATLEKVN